MFRDKCSVADKFRHLMQRQKELDLVPKIMEVGKHVIHCDVIRLRYILWTKVGDVELVVLVDSNWIYL